MPRLLLLVAIVFAIYYFRQKILKAPAAQRKGLLWKYGLISLALVLAGLAAAGRVHWISAIIAAALPLARQLLPVLIRYFPQLHHHYKTRQGQQGPNAGNQSSMATSILKMQMDHASGQLSGEVLSGSFSGRQLDSMNLQELLVLFNYCQQQDPDSARLLASYLDHRFGEDWQDGQGTTAHSDMTEQEALKLLGLATNPSAEDIIQAHRRLIQKVHPDRGGNDYLAAKINQAKDLLLAGLGR